MALALLAVAYSSLTVAGTGICSLPADVAPSSKHVGSIGGIQNFASNFAGIITPIVIGMLLDATGSFVAPLGVIGVIALIGPFNYLVILGKIEPLPVLNLTRTRSQRRRTPPAPDKCSPPTSVACLK